MENNSQLNNKTPLENKPRVEEEINFMEVMKNPKRWFGLIYPYFIILFLIAGIFFARNMNTAAENDVSPVLADSANIFNDIEKPLKGNVSKSVALSEITQPSQSLIDKGKSSYQTNCASCHGQNGMGDGPAGTALNPKPRNFQTNQGWKNGRKFSDIFNTINKGIPGSGMPAFEYLPNEDKVALTLFIRTFANDYPAPDEAEVAELDKTYSLSQGTQSSAQIPVAQAVELISADAVPRVQNVYDAVSYINNNPAAPGTQLFNRVANDKVKVLSYLSTSQTWKGSVNDFVKTVTSSLTVNGFKPDIVNLSMTEWNELYSFILRLNISKS